MMDSKELKAYEREALLGALGALLMLAGDLCLSMIPASPGADCLPVKHILTVRGSGGGCRCCLQQDCAVWRWAFSRCVFPAVRYCRSIVRPERRFLRAA